jgi:hypothetical protein
VIRCLVVLSRNIAASTKRRSTRWVTRFEQKDGDDMNRHMKRKLRTLGLFAATLTITAQMALAAITPDSVVTAYQAEGYTHIEVKVGATQIKVEAIKGDVKVETIYDIETGDVLKTESSAVEAGEDLTPGVSIDEDDGDFVDAGDGVDDDGHHGGHGGDDHGDDNGNDDGGDDDNGDDDGGDDDGGDDDNGSDDDGDDSGDDDGGNDDGGDDDNGSDDDGGDDNSGGNGSGSDEGCDD